VNLVTKYARILSSQKVRQHIFRSPSGRLKINGFKDCEDVFDDKLGVFVGPLENLQFTPDEHLRAGLQFFICAHHLRREVAESRYSVAADMKTA
jgi:hypothetical protein